MRTVALAAALLLAAVTGCGDRERTTLGDAVDSAATQAVEPVQETGGANDAPRTYAFEDRRDFAQSVRDRLADLDRRTEELTSQAKPAGAVSDRALANIRALRSAVEKNLGRVDAATAENWEEIRRGADGAVERLAEAVEGAYPK